MPLTELPLPFHPAVRYQCWELPAAQDVGSADLPDPIDGAKDQLICEAFGAYHAVEAFPSRKPKPVQGVHISFSHSRELIVLAYGSCNVGIDLQYYTDKLVRVSSKFISEHERSLLSTEEQQFNRQVHYMWCAKEAVFKLYGTEVPFKDIVSDTLDLRESGEIGVTVKGLHRHTVNYCFFNDFCFCIAT
ncbi:MAG: 4'-phosphopantetheinyl transferase superfamily protein [Bacteroidota bacterium]